MIKKLLIVLCVAVTLCMTFCTKNKKAVTSEQNIENTLNVDSILVKDYAKVKTLTKDSVAFYEAQIAFDRLLTADTCPSAVRVITVMQSRDTVWTVSHAINEAPVLTKEFGFWLEDLPVNLNRTTVSLDSAIVLLHKANIKTPASNLCVFRRPLYKTPYTDAFYIFGSAKTSFVNVDCHNGKVTSAKQWDSVSRKALSE